MASAESSFGPEAGRAAQRRARSQVAPISDTDVASVAAFMQAEMGSGVSQADWMRVMNPPWKTEQPNHGFFLHQNGRVVGAYLAMYSERIVDGKRRQICNLGAWCVAEAYRADGLRMIRSLLRQKGYLFTDLTPNPTVVALDGRLGFTALDTTTYAVPNFPWPFRSGGVRVVDSAEQIEGLLTGRDYEIYQDHAATTVRHAVLSKDGATCYVMYRREWYKHLPMFATLLRISNPELFQKCQAHFYRYLLLRQRIPATLIELRVAGHRPTRSISVPGRTRMFLGENVDPAHIDYLYSELTCLKD